VNLGKPTETDREADVWFLKRLLEANRDGEVHLFTSTLTIAECRHVGDKDISDDVKSQFNRLLMSGQYVRLVQMTPFIASDARDLHWVHGIIGLSGADAIHIASAIDRECEEFLTANGRLERLGKQTGQLIRFGLYSRRGKDTICLPTKYRQMKLDDDGTRH
jgi:predicted nucleic acid-binding protein